MMFILFGNIRGFLYTMRIASEVSERIWFGEFRMIYKLWNRISGSSERLEICSVRPYSRSISLSETGFRPYLVRYVRKTISAGTSHGRASPLKFVLGGFLARYPKTCTLALFFHATLYISNRWQRIELSRSTSIKR